MKMCSFRADFPVFFGVFPSGPGGFRRGGHLVGDRQVGFALELHIEPDPAIDLGVSLAGVERPKVTFRDQVEDSVDLGSLLEVDVGVEPFREAVVPKDADSERGRAGVALPHPDRVHVGTVGEV